DGIVLAEDYKLGVILLGCWLPGKLDGVVGNILNRELTNLECGRQHGTLKCRSTGSGLILVQRGGEILFEKCVDTFLEGRDTNRTSNHFDRIDLLNGQASIIQCLLKRSLDTRKQILRE